MGKFVAIITLVAVAAGAWFGLSPSGSGDDLNVLFIGNSYTHYNNMPSMVSDIADANGVSMNTEMIAPGGHFLNEHLGDQNVLNAISSGDFDFVVMQEQSVAPAHSGRLQSQTLPAAQSLGQIARESLTPVVWYETWGHRNGSGLSGHFDYASMQAALTAAYSEIGGMTGWPVARVGSRWAEVRRSAPSIELYDPDGSHPSEAGSFLAALVLADALLTVPIEDHGGVIDDPAATAIFDIAIR